MLKKLKARFKEWRRKREWNEGLRFIAVRSNAGFDPYFNRREKVKYKFIICGVLFWGGFGLIWWQTNLITAIGSLLLVTGIVAHNKPDF